MTNKLKSLKVVKSKAVGGVHDGAGVSDGGMCVWGVCYVVYDFVCDAVCDDMIVCKCCV